MYDLIIKNGLVIDGTGSPAFHSDVAVEKGKIVRIARGIKENAKTVIDAKGLTVTPGFIDSHAHSDCMVFATPGMKEKIEQGITTSVGGNCGISIAPIEKNLPPEKDTEIEGYGKKSEVLKTFSTFAKAVKDKPLGSNLVTLVGHGELRKTVMGYGNRKPTADEMEQMKVLLRDAMENGAIGISFGLIYTPSCYADTEELIEFAKVVKEYEGIVSAHIRNEGYTLAKAVEEFLTVIKATNVKAVFSHHKSMYKENWGKVSHTLRMIDEAVKEGYDIYLDVYPYSASQTNLATTVIAEKFRDTDGKGLVKLLSDPEMRKKIKEAYNKGDNLDNLMLTACEQYPEYVGKRISEIAKLRGQDDFDAAFDIISDTEGNAQICNFCICEEDVESVMKYERAMICTDSSVVLKNKRFHPRMTASFPRAVGRYVRERKVVSLHEMIRKCTSMPASVYGLPTKGILREGFDADICIFDADKLIDKADFVNCTERCEGLNYVILNGEVVAENAVYNGKYAGEVILKEI